LATINAVVAGNDGVTKTGAGTLVLTAANTYTGGTTVRFGGLNLDFSANELGSLVREQAARFPRWRGSVYRACAALLQGVLAIA